MKTNMLKKNTTLPYLKNQDWKRVKVETEKNNQIINKYLNEQHHGMKGTNLCRSEICLWKYTEIQNLDGKSDWKHK